MIDSHCHFDFPEFDQNREKLWRSCQEKGLRKLLIPGVSPQQWPRAQALCEEFEAFYFAAGIHPWWLNPDEFDLDGQRGALFSKLEATVQHFSCIGVGECGLDKIIAKKMQLSSSQNVWLKQQQMFEAHIEFAKQCNKPVILHAVKAHAEILAILKAYRPSAGGVVHAFSGSEDIAKQYWQLGCRLGIGGTISYARARKTRDAVSKVPLEALLLETDAPSMPLAGEQGQLNSPEKLPVIARLLAELRGVSLATVIEATTFNFSELFGVEIA